MGKTIYEGSPFFPKGMPVERQKQIAQTALELLRKDAALDDNIYTPPGAIGYNPGPEYSAVPAFPKDRPPHNSGAMALEVPVQS